MHPDNFPVWSPDGSKVAFIDTETRRRWTSPFMTVATESFQEHALLIWSLVYSSQRMTWSPNGDSTLRLLGSPLAAQRITTATPSVYVTDILRHFDDSGQVLGFGGPGMPFRIRTRENMASLPADRRGHPTDSGSLW